jgi:hypothetical protein
VALVIQPLLVDTRGEVEPVKMVIDVQLRMFQKTTVEKTRIGVYAIRRRLLRDAASGFMAPDGEDAYFPAAGNDYSYASPKGTSRGAPLVVKQRTRCAMCHGEDLTGLMTFAMAVPPNEGLGPPVRQLNPAGHEAADLVISKKMERGDWKSLGKYFQK